MRRSFSGFFCVQRLSAFILQQMEKYFKIGKIVATHGVTGKVVLQHSLGKVSDLKGTEAIFLEIQKDNLLPYFIKSATSKNEEQTFLELEQIGSPESAKKILRKEVWLAQRDFEKHRHASAPISLLGFTAFDQKENLGEILEVIEQKHQTLCKVMLGKNEAWLPVHEETLKHVDAKKRQVFLQLPDGLLDVYRDQE